MSQSPFELARRMLFTSFPDLGRARVEWLYLSYLVAQWNGAMEVGVILSTTEHKVAGIRFIAKVHIGERMIIVYFSGMLMYENM